MEDEKIQIGIDADGANLTVSGAGTSRLTEGLADALSPFTNSLGAIGDVVRTYRQSNAIRGLSRARALATRLNLPVQSVSPKFLVDWIEGISLEEEGEEDLTDLWAGLLVSASQGHRPSHYMFKRILRDISAEHARFLIYLCGGSGFSGKAFSRDIDQPYTHLDNTKWYYRSSEDADPQLKLQFEQFKFYGVRPIIAVLGCSHTFHRVDEVFAQKSDPKMAAYLANLVPQTLEAIGLVRRRTASQYDQAYQDKDVLQPMPHGLSYPVHISWDFIELTGLGHQFLLSSSGHYEAVKAPNA